MQLVVVAYPPIRNLFDSVEKLTWFLSGSAKRKAIFLEVAATHKQDSQLLELLTDHTLREDDTLSNSVESIAQGGRKACVPKFCSTHWTDRVTTLSALIGKYMEVMKTFVIVEARSDSSSYVRLLEDSQFIIFECCSFHPKLH